MSSTLKQGEEPDLGIISRTKMISNYKEVTRKNYPQNKPSLQTGGVVSLNNKQPKHFDDGPPLPLSPSQEQHGLLDEFKEPDLVLKKLSFKPKIDNYKPGQVNYTNNAALVDLAKNVQTLSFGTTGAIVEDGFVLNNVLYEKGPNFRPEKYLSTGAFGSCDLCKDIQSEKRFVCKSVLMENFKSSEVTIPINLNHENLTKCYGLIHRNEEGQNPILELLIEPAGMALNTYAQENTIETPRIWDIAQQTLAGLNHMHNYGMIHFDIKPHNICIEERGGKQCTVKITDFGSATLPQEQIQFGWTPLYMCPETSQLCLQKKCSMIISGKVDVFAAALVIMYLYEKVHVLQKLITKDETAKNVIRMLAEDQDIFHRVLPGSCDIDMVELLKGMTQYDPLRRFSAQDAINSIDRREKMKHEVILECQRRLQPQENAKALIRDSSISDLNATNVPEIAYNCPKNGRRPIKKSKNDALRKNGRRPIKKSKNDALRKNGRRLIKKSTNDALRKKLIKGNGKMMKLQELRQMVESAAPYTSKLNMQRLNNGQVKIHMTGPVQVQQTHATVPLTQNRCGLIPFMPTSSPTMIHGEKEFPDASGSEMMEGNMPNFLKLFDMRLDQHTSKSHT